MFPFKMLSEALFGGSAGTAEGTEQPAQSTSTSRPVGKPIPTDPRNPGLPRWFRRKSGRRYNIMSSEGPLGDIRRAAYDWGS